MIVETLALVVRLDEVEVHGQSRQEYTWSKTVEVLLPQMGTWYDRFQPAGVAWCKLVSHPLGVVLGSDLETFRRFYHLAKFNQEMVVRHNIDMLEHLAGEAKSLCSFQNGRFSVYGMESSKGLELIKYMAWHDDIMDGKLVPGAGIYYCDKNDRQFDLKTDERIFRTQEQYALCLVDIITAKEA